MSLLTGFDGMLSKELKELLREKRLFVILTVLALVLAVPFTAFLASSLAYGAILLPSDILLPLTFILPIALIVAALTFAADCVSKEKDSGMLGLVLSSPVTTEGFLAAKVVGTFGVYGAVALLVLLFGALLATGFGWVMVTTLVWLFLIPLLALWIFLLGLALLVSVTMGGSKSAVGIAIAVYLPMFLLTPTFLGDLIRALAPKLYEYLEYNPFAMAMTTGQAILVGAPFAWTPVVVSVLLGVACGGLAYVLFRRQEVSA